MNAEKYIKIHGSPIHGIGLPQRVVKSTLQTALCCISGNTVVVNDKVKNGDKDLRRWAWQS